MNRYKLTNELPKIVGLRWRVSEFNSNGFPESYECVVGNARLSVTTSNCAEGEWCAGIWQIKGGYDGSDRWITGIDRDQTESCDQMKAKTEAVYRQFLYRGAPSVVVGGQ